MNKIKTLLFSLAAGFMTATAQTYETEITVHDDQSGRDEVIEVKHSALSRDVFASGAVNAAVFLAGQTQPGLYNMSHVIASMK